ncbi:MAG: IPT/TIG domain-containing protein [Candidatus Sulfotelmatobacter sp.]
MKVLQPMKPFAATLLLTLIAFTLACGYSSKSTPPVAGSVPTIAQLAPPNATHGGAAFTLTVNGTNFGAQAVVNWNGVAQASSTTYVSGSQLTLAVPASAITAAATVSVTVTNPGTPGTGMYGGGTLPETSAAMSFAVN